MFPNSVLMIFISLIQRLLTSNLVPCIKRSSYDSHNIRSIYLESSEFQLALLIEKMSIPKISQKTCILKYFYSKEAHGPCFIVKWLVNNIFHLTEKISITVFEWLALYGLCAMGQVPAWAVTWIRCLEGKKQDSKIRS